LVPGGKAAIADWTIAPDLNRPERALLRRLCEDGRLSSLGTLDEYREF
ncbi:MAG: SAM-dependent methyltransferase, partial [Akkermansiaceae bacterium]|nr:SAM-dependent methyltransferase [Akkermansiaceae bacterium]